MTKTDLAATRIYTDFQGFNELRSAARDNSPQAVHEVATQFEALFIQMMLKSMRDAKLTDGILDSDQTQMYLGMFDQQVAVEMAARQTMGIADLLSQQLNKSAPTGEKPAPVPNVPAGRQLAPKPGDQTTTAKPVAAPGLQTTLQEPVFNSAREFVDYMRPLAERAASQLGTDPDVLIAQAALETGWGKRLIRSADGNNSYNLFGIKSDNRWSGPATQVASMEYSNGQVGRRVSAFRVYDSYQQSFDDYVDFVKNNPQYRAAAENNGDARTYIEGLRKAGYATDPHYAEKVLDIVDRIVI